MASGRDQGDQGQSGAGGGRRTEAGGRQQGQIAPWLVFEIKPPEPSSPHPVLAGADSSAKYPFEQVGCFFAKGAAEACTAAALSGGQIGHLVAVRGELPKLAFQDNGYSDREMELFQSPSTADD